MQSLRCDAANISVLRYVCTDGGNSKGLTLAWSTLMLSWVPWPAGPKLRI